MIYKNLSGMTSTFYGVTFNPGDTKCVPGIINAPNFIPVAKLPETVSEKSTDNNTPAPKPTEETDTEEKVDGRRKSKTKGLNIDGTDIS